MSLFRLHTIDSAPDGAKALLADGQKRMGFVPNLYAGLAESPAALQAYFDLSAALVKTQLTPTQQQVALLVTSVENGCTYCVAAHSMIAKKMAKVDPAVVAALRERRPIPDPKLEALAQFTRRVVQQRGWLDDAAVQAFLDAGYSRANVLDVIMAVTMKTLSNYANHLLQTPLDAAFEDERWEKTGT
ncbi:MAG: carboxymuconolactone decarboxylase family protein [Immundisolibacter sp.]